MNKRITANRYKPEVKKTKSAEVIHINNSSIINIDVCLKCIMIIAFTSVFSLAAIFVYNFICQSKFFNIKNIEISGTYRTTREEILKLADLSCDKNIYQTNLTTVKKIISSHPWIESVSIKRDMDCKLFITVVEQTPIAIVNIKNMADILINTKGKPFKEHNPQKEKIENLPIITGVNLKLETTSPKRDNHYNFNGSLFNSIIEVLTVIPPNDIKQIKADSNTGISIEVNDIYNQLSLEPEKTISISLGFNNYKAKLNKAIKISEYIDKNFPEKRICAMDLFNFEKIFIKTESDRLLQNG